MSWKGLSNLPMVMFTSSTPTLVDFSVRSSEHLKIFPVSSSLWIMNLIKIPQSRTFFHAIGSGKLIPVITTVIPLSHWFPFLAGELYKPLQFLTLFVRKLHDLVDQSYPKLWTHFPSCSLLCCWNKSLHLDVSENSVTLNPMVNDHYPY